MYLISITLVYHNFDISQVILVDRGWVPMKMVKPAKRMEGQIQGEVKMTGIVRHHENRPPLMPKSTSGKERVFMYRY